MISRSRIQTIYRKELLDILRDRRTLAAMIVIPVVLYPLIMLAFVRAAESEQARLESEEYVVEVPDASTQAHFEHILQVVAGRRPPDRPMPRFNVQIGDTPPDQWNEQIHAHLALAFSPQPPPLPPQVTVQIHYNEVDVRSRTAVSQLQTVFDEYRELLTREVLSGLLAAAPGEQITVDQLLKPVEVNTLSTATERQRGGWALGQIIPLVLVLMTITGAIYPAIDLTAGERERGTLETIMVAPVPPMHLIVGKFFVVFTIAMITAALNVGSVGATMHFSGLTQALSAEMPVQFPLSVLPMVLLCLVPFALLFSAILLAVCSFARTFKEAQNYIMPVMIVSLIPAFAATFPSVRLERGMLVMPVGNMVLLARELLQGTWTWTQVAVVVLSTGLYATAAIAVAARLFGQEAVLFADTRSYRVLLTRRFFVPAERPPTSHALLLAALLFPASFYAQSLLGDASGAHFARMLGRLALLQFLLLFVIVPLAVCIYFKIDLRSTFSLRTPSARAVIGALFIGLSSWALANEFIHAQARLLPPSRAVEELSEKLLTELKAMPLPLVILFLAVIPAITEELLFRGFVLSGLARGFRKWAAIAVAGLIFGIYHFMFDRIPVTTLIGILLGCICWQTRSILPGMIIHALHNAISTTIPMVGHWPAWTGLADPDATHLPLRILIPAAALFLIGLVLAAAPAAAHAGNEPPQGGIREPVRTHSPSDVTRPQETSTA